VLTRHHAVAVVAAAGVHIPAEVAAALTSVVAAGVVPISVVGAAEWPRT
jgi:hypothetical protein